MHFYAELAESWLAFAPLPVLLQYAILGQLVS